MAVKPEIENHIQHSSEFEALARSRQGLNVIRVVASQYYAPGEERQDLEQEGMIGLWEATQDFNPEGGLSFHNFAILCVQRNIITAVKTATRHKHSPLNESVDIQENNPDEGLALEEVLPSTYRATPEETIICKEWLFSFSDVFRGFSPFVQEAYRLCILQGLSYDEAANELGGVTEKTIDNAIQRAKRKMHKELDSPFIH